MAVRREADAARKERLVANVREALAAIEQELAGSRRNTGGDR